MNPLLTVSRGTERILARLERLPRNQALGLAGGVGFLVGLAVGLAVRSVLVGVSVGAVCALGMGALRGVRPVLDAVVRRLRGESPAAQRERIDRLTARKDAHKEWERVSEQMRRSGVDAARLPRILVLGPSAAGKTSLCWALRSVEVAGGEETMDGNPNATVFTDLHVTQSAVLVDAAGRLAVHRHDHGAPDADDEDGAPRVRVYDRQGWKEFLKLVAEDRPDDPVAAVVLCVSSVMLRTASAELLDEVTRALTATLGAIPEMLGRRVPVYMIVTKCDRLCGFRELSDLLTPTERAQPLGWARTGDTEKKWLAPASRTEIEHGLDTVIQRLFALRTRVLERPGAEREAPALMALVSELRHIREPLVALLSSVLRGGSLERPFLRGVYFTSTVARGSVLSALAEISGSVATDAELARLENDLGSAAINRRGSKQSFLDDLWERKIFGELGMQRLVSVLDGRVRRVTRATRVGLSALAVAGVVLLGVHAWSSMEGISGLAQWVTSARAGDSAAIVRVARYVPDFEGALGGAEPLSVDAPWFVFGAASLTNGTVEEALRDAVRDGLLAMSLEHAGDLGIDPTGGGERRAMSRPPLLPDKIEDARIELVNGWIILELVEEGADKLLRPSAMSRVYEAFYRDRVSAPTDADAVAVLAETHRLAITALRSAPSRPADSSVLNALQDRIPQLAARILESEDAEAIAEVIRITGEGEDKTAQRQAEAIVNMNRASALHALLKRRPVPGEFGDHDLSAVAVWIKKVEDFEKHPPASAPWLAKDDGLTMGFLLDLAGWERPETGDDVPGAVAQATGWVNLGSLVREACPTDMKPTEGTLRAVLADWTPETRDGLHAWADPRIPEPSGGVQEAEWHAAARAIERSLRAEIVSALEPTGLLDFKHESFDDFGTSEADEKHAMAQVGIDAGWRRICLERIHEDREVVAKALDKAVGSEEAANKTIDTLLEDRWTSIQKAYISAWRELGKSDEGESTLLEPLTALNEAQLQAILECSVEDSSVEAAASGAWNYSKDGECVKALRTTLEALSMRSSGARDRGDDARTLATIHEQWANAFGSPSGAGDSSRPRALLHRLIEDAVAARVKELSDAVVARLNKDDALMEAWARLDGRGAASAELLAIGAEAVKAAKQGVDSPAAFWNPDGTDARGHGLQEKLAFLALESGGIQDVVLELSIVSPKGDEDFVHVSSSGKALDAVEDIRGLKAIGSLAAAREAIRSACAKCRDMDGTALVVKSLDLNAPSASLWPIVTGREGGPSTIRIHARLAPRGGSGELTLPLNLTVKRQ